MHGIRKKPLLFTLISMALMAIDLKAEERTISSYISEHRIAICILATLCLGITLHHYFFKADASDNKVSLIPLNATNPNPSTVFLFAHGIDPRSNAATTQAARYINSGAITSTCYTFCFHDRLNTLNFGQEKDCDKLASAYAQVKEKHPHASLVLVGISRGASAIINTMAAHRDVDWSPVKAVILESPYEHVEGLIEHIMNSYAPFVLFGKNILYGLLQKLTAYRSQGIQSIDMIERFPQHIPLFISYSKTDKTVCPECTRTLIMNMQSSNHTITSYEAESGRHSTLAEQPAYAAAVQDFLAQHGL